MFISAAKILGCLVLAIAYSPVLRTGPAPNIVFIVHIIVFGGAAVFLMTAGARDSRAVDLGGFFLVVATAFANGLTVRFTGLPAVSHQIQQVLLALHPEAFLPLFLWLFVTRFPRLHRFDRGQRAERIFVLAATVAGVACFVASALSEMARGSIFSGISAIAWGRGETWFWTILFGLAIPALPFGLWKARRADVRERRRFSVFVTGLLIGFLPMAAEVLAEATSESYLAFISVPPRQLIGAFILYPLLLSIPFTTAYSVLVHRVLDVKLIVRKAVQYALARFTIAVLATIPAVALGVSLVRHRRETIGALFATPSVIVVPLAVLLTVLAARRSLLERIDRWFFREALDTHALLGALASTSVVSGDTLSAACGVLSDRLQTTLHLVQADILVADWQAGVLASAARRLRPLPLDGRLASVLAGRPDPIEVELEHPGPLLRDLPLEDQQWLADSGVHLLMPLHSGNEFMGAIALGEKLSDLPFSRDDQLALAPVAAALALKIENQRLREVSLGTPREAPRAEEQRWADDPALVCSSCSVIAPSGANRCVRCDGTMTPTQLPAVLAGKFRLERELGRGGMGVVYLAFDTALERRVAIKALPRVSVAESVRLRREARAMAGFAHAHLALIFGIESWRGSPALVMEYLEGGTLADRLRRSRLAPAEAARVAYDLAGAIALIHGAGLLHRDIKPSNIAFTNTGEPKLLDFGLAQMFTAGAPEDRHRRPSIEPGAWMTGADLTTAGHLGGFAGTPAYMAPEAVIGESLDGTSDMWSFGVVLFESLTGEHPFKGRSLDADWVREVQSRVPDCPPLLGQLVADLLAADKRKRPTSAHAVRMRLREYVLSSALETSRLVGRV